MNTLFTYLVKRKITLGLLLSVSLVVGALAPAAKVRAMALASSFVFDQKLTASDGLAFDRFGDSVAIDGDTAVVGARLDDTGQNDDQGSAYVFARSNGVWSEQQKLVASDGSGNAFYGCSVAISGDTIVVGASLNISAAPDVYAGAAFVYVKTGGVWTEQQKLVPSDVEYGQGFGCSVAISGNTILVGSRFNKVGSNVTQGSAYVFVRNGGVWSEQQKLTSNDGDIADFFGSAVAISGDTAIIGAPNDDAGGIGDQGSAYIFFRTGSFWSQQSKLTANIADELDFFGNSVALGSDIAVVGATSGGNANQGSAHIFARSGFFWFEVKELTASDGVAGDLFGSSIGISGDIIVAGARWHTEAGNEKQGAAYVFERDSGQWLEQQKLTAADGVKNDDFGSSAAISGESIIIGSNFAAVGATAGQGSAYVFENVPNTTPSISASAVSVLQGASTAGAAIATVSDVEDDASTLAVTVVPGGTATGINITDITNIGGALTANVAATGTATSGTVLLRVTDSGGLIAEDSLDVTVILFDKCIKNDTSNKILRFNSATGAWEFRDCTKSPATQVSGTGTVTSLGCKIFLNSSSTKTNYNTANATFNTCTFAATATVTIGSVTQTLNDSDFRNSPCTCP